MSKSRPARWAEATSNARDQIAIIRQSLADASSARDALEAALEDLQGIQSEYQDWLDGLADVARGTATEDKLNEVTGLTLEAELGDIPDPDDVVSDAESVLDEAEAADLPRGFGRD